MAKQWLRYDSIYGGLSPFDTVAREDQYLAGIAIDPDAPISDSSTKPGGIIRPIGLTERSGSVVDQVIAWIVAPANGNVVAYAQGGDLYSYSTAAFGDEALARAVSASSGNGLAYYNGYLYYGRNLNIGRTADLSTFDDSYWVTTLGLTAPTSTILSVVRQNALDSFRYPSMPMHVHIDNKLYWADYSSGRGHIHFIKTNSAGANDGSTYQALDLPFGYYVYDIESFGLQLAILASSGSDQNSTRKGATKLFLWDTVSSSFSAAIDVPDPIGSALLNANGVLYGWSGSSVGGVRFWRYIGGDSIETIEYINDSYPPPAGAVGADGHRILWGGYTTYPVNAPVVFAWNTKSGKVRSGVHVIARSNLAATSTDGGVTAIGITQPSSKSFPPISVAATTGSASASGVAIETKGTTYQTSVWRGRPFNIGRPFTVEKVLIPLAQAVAANMTIVPKLFFDNEAASSTGTTINNTNYANSEKIIKMSENNFSHATYGKHNFFLELTISGTTLSAVSLPILILVDIPDVV